ncbi:MAG: hypothetical protein ACOC9Y_05225 [Chloroflexota bacterium]
MFRRPLLWGTSALTGLCLVLVGALMFHPILDLSASDPLDRLEIGDDDRDVDRIGDIDFNTRAGNIFPATLGWVFRLPKPLWNHTAARSSS